eukprot:1425896-Rhodomonas_salina.1
MMLFLNCNFRPVGMASEPLGGSLKHGWTDLTDRKIKVLCHVTDSKPYAAAAAWQHSRLSAGNDYTGLKELLKPKPTCCCSRPVRVEIQDSARAYLDSS